jgi:hypothetical protein
MFILIGLCKRTGSGLKTIETTWKNDGESALDLIQAPEPERTILTLHVELDVLEEVDLEETLEDTLDLFPREEALTKNSEEMDDSVNKEINSSNSESNSVNNEKNSLNNKGNSVNKEDDSDNNRVESVIGGVNSVNNSDNSSNKEDAFNSGNNQTHVTHDEKTDIIVNDLTNEPKEKKENFFSAKEIEEELWEISELARRKKRLQPSTMEAIIVRLCATKPLMLKELAYLLERTPDGLRNNYLAKLLRKGKVRLKYPEQLNHPKQAYIVVEKQGN